MKFWLVPYHLRDHFVAFQNYIVALLLVSHHNWNAAMDFFTCNQVDEVSPTLQSGVSGAGSGYLITSRDLGRRQFPSCSNWYVRQV